MRGFTGTQRFQVERQLGSGSMGAVYLVRDRRLGGLVALKTLLRVDATGIYRFKREFRALADLNHPNLVTLHELICDEGQWFFTMEYIEGLDLLSHVHGMRRRRYSAGSAATRPDGHVTPLESLEAHVEGLELLFPSPLIDPQKLRNALGQIISAVRTVHAAGRLHRDIKPENILVDREGRVAVLDFGISLDRKPDAHETLNNVMGTPAYMAPEQAFGEVCEASDWYALGIVLYEALTGHVPFDGEPNRILRMKQELDAAPPCDMVANVPRDLNDLCMALLHHDPTQRPTGDELLSRLRCQPRIAVPEVPRQARCFVGREGQLSALDEALAATEENKPVVSLVEGPSGIGKTTLVRHFVADMAERDRAVVLTGRCYERESVPFKAFDNIIDTLTRFLRNLPDVEAVGILPRDLEALTGLFPVLQRVDVLRRQRRRSAAADDPRELRARAFAALGEMLGRITDMHPLVVFIDDLQWSDHDSTRLLTHLLMGRQRPAMLLVCAYRLDTSQGSSAASQWLKELETIAGLDVRKLPVSALSGEASVELARQLLGPDFDEGAQRIGLESDGNPQLLSELAAYVRERTRSGAASRKTADGMIGFDKVLAQRMLSLASASRTLLELLSVAGRPVPEPMLTLVGSFNIDLSTALSELRAAKLIRGVTAHEMRAVEVYHDTIAAAVIRSLSPEELAGWHRRLAAALEATGAVDLEAVTDHLVGAGELARAAVYAERAGEQAAQGLAFDKAARLYRLAADHCQQAERRLELLERHADALANTGRRREAADAFLDAALQAQGTHARNLRTRTGIQLLLSGSLADAMRVLEEPLSHMNITLFDDPQQCIAHATMGMYALRERGFACDTQNSPIATQRDLSMLATLDGIIHGLAVYSPDQPAHLSARYAEEALKVGEPLSVVRALCLFDIYCDMPICRLEHLPSCDAVDTAETLARAIGEPEALAIVTLARGLRAYENGRLAEARPCLQRAEELFRDQCRGRVHEARLARGALCHIALLLGDQADGGTIDAWLREADEGGDAVTATRLRLLASAHALGRERPADCLAALETAKRAAQEVAGQAIAGSLLLVKAGHDLYAQDMEACRSAMDDVDGFLNTLAGSQPLSRGEALLTRARLGLAAAVLAPATTAADMVAEDLALVEALDLPCFDDELMLLRAALCIVDGQRQEAAAHCLESLLCRDLEEGPLPAVAARAWGQRTGQRRLVQRGEAALERLGIRHPEPYTFLRAPGLASAR